MLKINHTEVESLLEAPVRNLEQAAHAAAELQSRYAPLVMVRLERRELFGVGR